MIQRIQSVYLFLVLALSVLIFFFPVYEYGDHVKRLLLDEFKPDTNLSLYIFPVLICNVIIGLIAFIALFLYKNRKLQIKICKINTFLSMVLIASLFLYVDRTSADSTSIAYKTASIFPILMLLFSFLAKRAIQKDEDLVKSADRIR